MAAKQAPSSGMKHAQTRRQQVLEALGRGELVRLLAEVDAGNLDSRDLQAALEEYERKHWIRRAFAALLGKGI